MCPYAYSCVLRAITLADRLEVPFALINRKQARDDDGDGSMEILVGDVRDKVAILIDDMCDTGTTIKLAVNVLKEQGARSVYAVVSHGLLSGESMSIIKTLPIEKIAVTNTVSQTEHLKRADGKLEIMDVSPVLAESIRRSHNGESLSLLFTDGGASVFG